MPDLKPRHTAEKLNRLIEAVRRHDSPLPWENDTTRANQKIYDLWSALDAYQGANHLHNDGEAVLYNLGLAAIDKAKQWEYPEPTPEDLAAGYYPNSKSDPRD